MQLSLKGAISIREYSTDLYENKENTPDYHQLHLHDDTDTPTPVIPGTSWAGAFKERYEYFSDEGARKELFGYIDEKTKVVKKSQITFSESQISGAEYKIVTRNSIDRFSAGTKDGALYTERTCYNGTTKLIITVPNNLSAVSRKLLGACILDLNSGLLSVGGLTSIGRGVFSVDKILVNNIDKTDLMHSNSLAIMEEVKY